MKNNSLKFLCIGVASSWPRPVMYHHRFEIRCDILHIDTDLRTWGTGLSTTLTCFALALKFNWWKKRFQKQFQIDSKFDLIPGFFTLCPPPHNKACQYRLGFPGQPLDICANYEAEMSVIQYKSLLQHEYKMGSLTNADIDSYSLAFHGEAAILVNDVKITYAIWEQSSSSHLIINVYHLQSENNTLIINSQPTKP